MSSTSLRISAGMVAVLFAVAFSARTATAQLPDAGVPDTADSSTTTPNFAPPPGASTNPAAAMGQAPQHVHYHYHYNVPLASLLYPNYAGPTTTGTPNASYPLPANPFSPTPGNPYPTGYIPGMYNLFGFQNTNPNAPADEGIIHVFLPVANADVYLNGQRVRGKGAVRKYTTPPLQSNLEYQYWVTIHYEQNGSPMTDYRKVILGAGDYGIADFTRPAQALMHDPVSNIGVRFTTGPVNPNDVIEDPPMN